MLGGEGGESKLKKEIEPLIHISCEKLHNKILIFCTLLFNSDIPFLGEGVHLSTLEVSSQL